MNRFEKKNTMLIKAFGQHLREHPEIIDDLPDDTLLVMQIRGDAAFNAWSRRIAHPDKRQPVIYVKFTLKKKLARSRKPTNIEKLELQPSI